MEAPALLSGKITEFNDSLSGWLSIIIFVVSKLLQQRLATALCKWFTGILPSNKEIRGYDEFATSYFYYENCVVSTE